MDRSSDSQQLADLLESARQLVLVNQQVAHSLSNLEQLYATELARAAEDRKRIEKHREESEEAIKMSKEFTDRMLEQSRRSLDQSLEMGANSSPLRRFWPRFIVLFVLLIVILEIVRSVMGHILPKS